MAFEDEMEKDPFFIASQWQVGHVITQADIEAVQGMYDQWSEQCEDATAAYGAGREQLLREIGGQELVDAATKADVARFDYLAKKAMKMVNDQRAEYEEKAKNI